MTTFQKLKHEARRAEQRSDWRKAIALYREALRLDERRGGPDELGLYNRIGDLHIRLGEVAQAVECYELAADRYTENQLPTSAVALCNKILRVAPDRTDVFRRLALLHAATGLIAEARTAMLQYVDRMESSDCLGAALEAVQEYVNVADDNGVRVHVADLLSSRGHVPQAIAQLRFGAGAARERGGDASSFEARIRELGAVGDDDEQPADVEPSPVSRPVNLTEELLARFEAADGRPAGFVPVPAGSPTRELPRSTGPVADELAEFRLALGARLTGANAEQHYDLGVAFQSMGLEEEAVQELQFGLSDPSLRRSAAERIGSILGLPGSPAGGPVAPGPAPQAGSTRQDSDAPAGAASTEASSPPDLKAPFFRARLAQYRIRQAEESGEKDHVSHLELGAAYAEMGLAVEAARELAEASAGGGTVGSRADRMLLELARDPATASEVAVEILERLHSGGGAEGIRAAVADLAERLGEDHPERPRLDALRAGEAHEDPHGIEPESPPTLDDMLEQLEQVPGVPATDIDQERSDGAAVLVGEAQALMAEGRDDDACVKLLQALEMYEDARDFGEAIFALDLLLGIRPDDVVLHHQRAELARAAGDRATLLDSYMGLAASLCRQDAPESARTVYGRVLDIDPQHAEARERMDALSRRPHAAGQQPPVADARPVPRPIEEGSETFDALLEELKEPGEGEEERTSFDGDTQAHFELGVAFKQMEMWEEAISELNQALAGREDPRPVLEALADCHLRSGDAERAEEVLRQAEAHPANRDSPSAAIAYRIARLHEQRGEASQAVEWLLQVVSIDPDFRDAASRLSALSG